MEADAELVGREAELETIDAFLDRSNADDSPVLVLEGDAGVGKTTLWRAGVALARDSGYHVLVARPADVETGLPFAALADLVGDSLGEVGDALPPPQRRALEVALSLVDPADAPPLPPTIAAAVLSCLRELARDAPVLVAVDDTQWLDAASEAALEFALRRIGPDEQIRFLLTRRTGEQGDTSLGASGVGAPELVHVGPLSLGALHRVLAGHLGHSLPRPVLTRVHVGSGGNPFFALELARLAEQRGLRTGALELPLPASAAEALRERLDALPEATRSSLLVVAALATPTAEVVESALGASAGTLLQPAIDAGMLVLDGSDIHFSHPLTGAAVYREAWPSRRRACHAILAELVDDPDERVRHLALASEGHDSELAVALEDAAHRARRRGAPEAAATFVEQAWRATPREDADDAWRRGVLAAEYRLQSGDMHRFRELTEGLHEAARTGDERSVALQLLSIEPIGEETALGWLDRALEAAESTRQRQSVESDYVTEATVGGDLAEGLRHARESLRLAEELADAGTLADALSMVARLEQLLGLGLRRDLLARVDALHELRRTDRLEETVGVYRTTVAISGLLATADEFDEARGRSESMYELLEGQGLVQALPEVLRFRSELACLAGSWLLAGELAERGDELAEQTGREAVRGDLLYPRAFVAAHRGDVEAARALAEEGVATAERRSNHRNLLRHLAILGFVDLSLRDHAGAAGHLGRAAEVATAAGFVEPNWLRFHDDLGEALVGLGRLDEATALIAWLDERGRTSGYRWTLATAARCRGQLLAERGELDPAVAALEVALGVGHVLGNAFELGRTHLDLGRTHRRARRRVQARASLTEALRLFEETGAALWAQAARSELERISGRRAADPDTVTDAERRIAELVAAGRSNKEVAAELHLSVKTVEVTLTRIYRKLDVRSRTELAARFAGGAKQ